MLLLYQKRAFEIIVALGKGLLHGFSCSSQSILSQHFEFTALNVTQLGR